VVTVATVAEAGAVVGEDDVAPPPHAAAASASVTITDVEHTPGRPCRPL
jgi:hypothetical protein